MQSKVFSSNKTLRIGGKLWDLNTPLVMGILNVTPDSFYDGGKYLNESALLGQVEKMIREGVDIIDVGGHSTRPGAKEVSETEELERVRLVMKQVVKAFPKMTYSIDTYRASVAEAAVALGAGLINDISGGSLDPDMFGTVARLQVPYVLMHFRGTPQTMNQFTHYDNLIREVIDYFHPRIYQLTQLGVKDIIIDPGFGFAKNIDQNFSLLRDLDYLNILGKPILVGLSRKSMIWRILETTPDEALNGSTALHSVALSKGASILRVHDVKEAVECVRLCQKLNAYNSVNKNTNP